MSENDKKEIAKWYFSNIDFNKDNFISKDEFMKIDLDNDVLENMFQKIKEINSLKDDKFNYDHLVKYLSTTDSNKSYLFYYYGFIKNLWNRLSIQYDNSLLNNYRKFLYNISFMTQEKINSTKIPLEINIKLHDSIDNVNLLDLADHPFENQFTLSHEMILIFNIDNILLSNIKDRLEKMKNNTELFDNAKFNIKIINNKLYIRIISSEDLFNEYQKFGNFIDSFNKLNIFYKSINYTKSFFDMKFYDLLKDSDIKINLEYDYDFISNMLIEYFITNLDIIDKVKNREDQKEIISLINELKIDNDEKDRMKYFVDKLYEYDDLKGSEFNSVLRSTNKYFTKLDEYEFIKDDINSLIKESDINSWLEFATNNTINLDTIIFKSKKYLEINLLNYKIDDIFN